MRVSVVSLASLRVTHVWSALHDNPVTSVRLFSLSTRLAAPGFVSAALRDPSDLSVSAGGGGGGGGGGDGGCGDGGGGGDGDDEGGGSDNTSAVTSGREPLHLLVTNALAPSVVYSGLPLADGDPPPRRHTLADSDVSDVVTCSCVCDINMDSRNELVLGTYGQVRRDRRGGVGVCGRCVMSAAGKKGGFSAIVKEGESKRRYVMF